MFTNECLSKQPRKQFLWNEKQPRTYPGISYYDSCNSDQEFWLYNGKQSAYNRFFETSERVLPRLPSSTHYHRQRRTHAQAVQYVTRIWKTLLALLYGKEMPLLSKDWSWKTLQFLTDVVIYADYYGALSSIAVGVERCLLAIPKVWESVASHPEMFVVLAHEIKAKTLFVEAAKHLAGEDLEGRSGPHSIPGRRLPSGKEDTTELLRFLETTSSELKAVVNDLGTRLSHLPDDYTRIRPELVWDSNGEYIEWTQTRSKYALLARMVVTDLLNYNLHRPEEWRWNASSYDCSPSGDLTSWIRRVRKFVFDEEVVQSWVQRAAETASRDFSTDEDKIRDFLDYYTNHIREQFNASPLWGHNQHCCQEYAPGVSQETRACLDCATQCKRCERAEFETDDHFTYLPYLRGEPVLMMPKSLAEGETQASFWQPMADKQVQTSNRQSPQVPLTTPASNDYLTLLGLDHCIFAKGSATDAASSRYVYHSCLALCTSTDKSQPLRAKWRCK